MVSRASNSDAALNWRDHAQYGYTVQFTDRDWAWEGLRRNPEFRMAWDRARPDFDVCHSEPDVTVIKANGIASSLGRWGLLYCDPPHLDARDASVIWQPARTEVLQAIALSEIDREKPSLFQLGEVTCPTVILTEPGGPQHVLLRGRDCQLQLRVSGTSVLEPIHLVTDIVLDGLQMNVHLRALAMFNDLRTTGHSKLSEAIPKGRADRLRLVLQALDGFLANATLREIAVALFGADRVAQDWDDDHRHLKDRVRRAVARGRWLMTGGYMKYLK
jgi:hypothetical protein